MKEKLRNGETFLEKCIISKNGTLISEKLWNSKGILIFGNIKGTEQICFQSRDDRVWNFAFSYEPLSVHVKKAIREIKKHHGIK